MITQISDHRHSRNNGGYRSHIHDELMSNEQTEEKLLWALH